MASSSSKNGKVGVYNSTSLVQFLNLSKKTNKQDQLECKVEMKIENKAHRMVKITCTYYSYVLVLECKNPVAVKEVDLTILQ